MRKRLAVGNLSHRMTEAQLQTLFSEAGFVASVKIISYLRNGQPSGFGFVSMETEAECQKAIFMLNGRNVDGLPLAVKEDRPQSKCSFGRRSRNCQSSPQRRP